MSLFPMFLKLEGRSCLVIGAGVIGEPKIRSLLVSGATVRVIAPEAREAVQGWARAGVIVWEQRRFQAADLGGVFLVVAATSLPEVNEAVFQEASRRGILCNAVDDPERCDFFYGALVRRGRLQVAISTGGQSPALAQRLRRELQAQIRPEYAGWLERLGKVRRRMMAARIAPERRKRLLHELASERAFESRRLRRAGEPRVSSPVLTPEPGGTRP
jgi:precorrin-2 dehydrogenase/sirohydrochlorin ferrochelatase